VNPTEIPHALSVLYRHGKVTGHARDIPGRGSGYYTYVWVARYFIPQAAGQADAAVLALVGGLAPISAHLTAYSRRFFHQRHFYPAAGQFIRRDAAGQTCPDHYYMRQTYHLFRKNSGLWPLRALPQAGANVFLET